MANRIKLRGILEWAKIFEENRDLTGYKPTESPGNYEQYDGACTTNIILDEDNAELLRSTGFPRKLKPDPDGRGLIAKLDRKFNTGHSFSSGAPEVFDATTGDRWTFEDGLIGNGTVADVYLSVYTTQYKTVGSRIEKIEIIDYVEPVGLGPNEYESVSSTTPNATSRPIEKAEEIPF